MIWLSVPLGLLSWVIPIEFHKKKPAAVSAVSFGLCGLALLNVLWELYGRTVSGDYAALMDLTDNLVWCSVALVIGTVLLNLRLYLKKQFPRCSAFWITLLLQVAALLPAVVYACIKGSMSSLAGVLYCGVMLGLAVLALALYLSKTDANKLSLGVPLAVAAFFPVALFLFQLPQLLGIEADVLLFSNFQMIYFFPVLMMTSVGVVLLKLQHRLHKQDDKEKGETHESK